MYNINDFPEGTKITQMYFNPLDMQQGKQVVFAYLPLSHGNPVPNTVMDKIFKYSQDFSTAEYVQNPFGDSGVIYSDDIMDIDLSSCINLNYLIRSKTTCTKLIIRNMTNIKTINEFIYANTFIDEVEFIDCDFGNLTNVNYFLDTNNCVRKISEMNNISNSSLGFVNFTQTQTKLEEFGGFIGLKAKIDIANWSALNYESCINVLNGLHNFTSASETPTSSQGQLKVHQNFLDLVGDEISIGTNKGWTITA
jgi:hypothetical protein